MYKQLLVFFTKKDKVKLWKMKLPLKRGDNFLNSAYKILR